MQELIPNSTELFLHACQYYGEREVPGKESNATILEWLQEIFPWADNEIPWCSAFMTAIAKDCELEHMYVRETEKFIWVLGGNQSDQVNIRPYAKSRLLTIRRLNKTQGDNT